MQFDFTGVSGESGGVTLAPGRYRVSTQDRWTVTKNDSGNINLRIPFTVLESGEFEGATSSYYHTIMVFPDNYNSLGAKEKKDIAEKIYYNKTLTLQMFLALGLLSDADRRADDSLKADFEYGDKDEYGRVSVLSLAVNGERRSLGDRIATAVVVTSSYTKSGVKVDRLEANGKPEAPQPSQPSVDPKPQPAPEPQQPAKQQGIPF